jgi:Fe-S-cluster containining protein
MRCGICCHLFAVPVNPSEAYWLSRRYGNVLEFTHGKYYLREMGGRCIFLSYEGRLATCTIHLEKPLCCRLYPFRIRLEPKSGMKGDDALYFLDDRKFYVYLDGDCTVVRKGGVGDPIEDILPKFIRYWECYKHMLSEIRRPRRFA